MEKNNKKSDEAQENLPVPEESERRKISRSEFPQRVEAEETQIPSDR